MELPWRNAPPIQRDCFCSNRSLPISFKSKSSIVEVHFKVHSMNSLDDYKNVYFEGTWEFSKTTQCTQKRRVHGPSGEIKNLISMEDDSEVNPSLTCPISVTLLLSYYYYFIQSSSYFKISL
jgi:hypothetical protein